MKIEGVDFFYLSMPEVLDIGDGSQDALLVRIRAGGLEGWGECEGSPVTSIAGYVTPMSHSACKPLKYSLEGKEINSVADIEKISFSVHQNSFDLLQADHTLSGIDIALWDLLGKKREEPVYKLLGYKKSFPKLPYASQLFGDTAEHTYQKAKQIKQAGFKALKFGWAGFGQTDLKTDTAQLLAAREGFGEGYLMIDAGTAWGDQLAPALERREALEKIKAFWLEEPFANLALSSYNKFAASCPLVPLAGGEGCNNFLQAKAMIQFGGLKYIQIDAGRIGGITAAKKLVDLAVESNLTYVNHTFTSHLALSASLQPYAGIEQHFLCEYPSELKSLAYDITETKILRDENGYVPVPEGAGLGISVSMEALQKYLVDVEIIVKGQTIYHTPAL